MNCNQELNDVVELQELQRQFQFQEFRAVVDQLLHALQLNTYINIHQLYQEIKQNNNRVIGKDILRLLHVLKQEANVEKQLDAQIKFYRDTILQLANRGKNMLTIGEFFVSFVLNNPKKGIVTDQIQDKISQHKYILIEKLLSLIETIEKSRIESRSIKCSGSKFGQKMYTDESTLQLQFAQRSQIEQLQRIIIDNVHDEKCIEKVSQIIGEIGKKQKQRLALKEKYDDLQKLIQQKQRRFYEQMTKIDQVLQQKQSIINKLYQQNMRYEQQIQIFEEKCQQDFIQTITSISEQNQRLAGQRQQALNCIRQLQGQLEWYKNNYQDATKQNEKIVAQFEKQKCEIKSSQLQSIENVEARLKNEVKQAYSKINKLRKQNQDLKSKICDLETQLESKNIMSRPQTDRTFKNLTLEERVSSNISNNQEEAKQIFLEILRKQSYAEIDLSGSNRITYRGSQSKKLVRSITKEYFGSDFMEKQTTQQKQLQVNEHVRYKLHQFDYLGVLKLKPLNSLTQFLQNNVTTINSFKPIFSSPIEILNSNRPMQKLSIVISSNKFLFCTGNGNSIAAKLSLKFSEVLSVIICDNNRNLVMIKRKQKQPAESNQLPVDLLIRINYRHQLLKYLLKCGFLGHEQNQIRVIFAKQENTNIKTGNAEKALNNFLSLKNLGFNFIYDGQNFFQGKIKKFVNCLIVVNTLGILVFQKSSTSNQFMQSYQKFQKLKFILPFTKNMQFIDLSQQNKLKLIYFQAQKSYIMQFCCYAEVKLVLEKIKQVRQKNLQLRTAQTEKFMNLFSGFRKMRSVQQQSTLFGL